MGASSTKSSTAVTDEAWHSLLNAFSLALSVAAKSTRTWLCDNPSKRWTEVLFLAYSPFWITWALCILVPFQLYEKCDSMGYLVIGLCTATPCVALPCLLQTKADRSKPWHKRYWVKANIWIAIFSFIGNYFWTHYFYHVLGATYLFKSYELNKVPITLYFMTHAYFCFYHVLTNLCIRRARRAVQPYGSRAQLLTTALVVFLMAYATAYGETLTISHFPYYTFEDKTRMYRVGSLFYAIYFFVSFPVFFAMDEDQRSSCSVGKATTDALGCGMAVTILLDFWRLCFCGAENQTRLSDLVWSR